MKKILVYIYIHIYMTKPVMLYEKEVFVIQKYLNIVITNSARVRSYIGKVSYA